MIGRLEKLNDLSFFAGNSESSDTYRCSAIQL